MFTDDDYPTRKAASTDLVPVRGPAGRSARHRELVYVDRDVPSEFDRLTVTVVRLVDGRYAAYFSDVPDDASAAVRSAAVRAQESISLHV